MICLMAVGLALLLGLAGVMSYVAITTLLKERKTQKQIKTGVEGDLDHIQTYVRGWVSCGEGKGGGWGLPCTISYFEVSFEGIWVS